MSDQEVQTGEVDEAEKVLDVVFPSGDKSAEVVHPRKEPLHSPAPAVATQLTGILTPAAVCAGWARSSRCRTRLGSRPPWHDTRSVLKAQRRPIVHRSVPNVLSRRFAGPEQTQDRTNSPINHL